MSSEYTLQGYEEEYHFTWERIPLDQERKLGAELARWKGTPYVDGAQIPGEGSDCFRSVTGIENALRGEHVIAPEELPADAGMNNPQAARSAMRRLLRAYEARRVSDGTIKPGDFLATKSPGVKSGPGHAMIVGPHGQLWHMDYRRGFVATGRSLEGNTLEGVYRTDKSKWE